MRLIDADKLPFEPYGEDVISWYATGWNDAINVIDRAPTVDAEPVRHGEWIHDINNLYGCSECFNRETMSLKRLKPYCPNCGARMDGGKQDAQV